VIFWMSMSMMVQQPQAKSGQFSQSRTPCRCERCPWARDSDREGRLMSFLEDGAADALDELHAVRRGKAGGSASARLLCLMAGRIIVELWSRLLDPPDRRHRWPRS
jgi:hypothetical protein